MSLKELEKLSISKGKLLDSKGVPIKNYEFIEDSSGIVIRDLLSNPCFNQEVYIKYRAENTKANAYLQGETIFDPTKEYISFQLFKINK